MSNPNPIITIFTHTPHEVGDKISVTERSSGNQITGTVVGRCCDEEKYQGHTLCGGRSINTGEGYYRVDIPDGDSGGGSAGGGHGGSGNCDDCAGYGGY